MIKKTSIAIRARGKQCDREDGREAQVPLPWDQPAVVRNHKEVEDPPVFVLEMQIRNARERAVAMGIACDTLRLRRGTRKTGIENKGGSA